MTLGQLLKVTATYNDIIIKEKDGVHSWEIERIRNNDISYLKNRDLLNREVTRIYADSVGYLKITILNKS